MLQTRGNALSAATAFSFVTPDVEPVLRQQRVKEPHIVLRVDGTDCIASEPTVETTTVACAISQPKLTEQALTEFAAVQLDREPWPPTRVGHIDGETIHGDAHAFPEPID